MSTPELSIADLKQILSFTTTLARKAGALILEGSQAIQSAPAKDINEKKNSVDLVTEYDVKVEKMVKKEIAETYPGFKFIGEESYDPAGPPLTDEPTFCVDPIDGTTNFVHGFPYVCISLGLIYKKRPVLGVIYNPFLDHLYTGLKSQGSYLTRSSQPPLKLPLSPPKPLSSLSQALVAVEWGSDRSKTAMDGKGGSFMRLAGDPNGGGKSGEKVERGRMAHSLRSMGSAALNFAMVAQGGLDLYWEIGCWPWDVCAGIVIAQEAGAIITGSSPSFASALSSFYSSQDQSSSSPKLSNDTAPFEMTPEILTGRKYLVVRAILGEDGETGLVAQSRIVQEFYGCVDDFAVE